MSDKPYKTTNDYKITFKDGTDFKSDGVCNSLEVNTVKEELNWLINHISVKMYELKKTKEDLESISININWSEESKVRFSDYNTDLQTVEKFRRLVSLLE